MNTKQTQAWEANPIPPTPKEFITAWQTSTTVAEVAAKLRMRKGPIRVRAHRYRKRGIPLKQYVPLELPVVDWAGLAEYAVSLVAHDSRTGGGSGTTTNVGELANAE